MCRFELEATDSVLILTRLSRSTVQGMGEQTSSSTSTTNEIVAETIYKNGSINMANEKRMDMRFRRSKGFID